MRNTVLDMMVYEHEIRLREEARQRRALQKALRREKRQTSKRRTNWVLTLFA
ncbi:MAG: hypothetical protein SF029_10845 [bacterium]|nr:hypothetical protein [bacterium]